MTQTPLHIQDLRHSARRHETVAGAVIILVLAVIGVMIFLQQFKYDEHTFAPRIVQQDAQRQTAEGSAPPVNLAALAPRPYVPMSDRDVFDAETLSDKINGKADAYLEAGFVRLTARRFVHSSDPGLWFEFFVYDMGRPRNAFAVYSTQKRAGVVPAGIGKFSYLTENAVFFFHGSAYVEIIAARADDGLLRAMVSMSKKFAAAFTGETVDLPEVGYLTVEGLDPGSVRMIVKNGFGFEGFDNLFTGEYRIDGHTVTAFVSIRESNREAAALAAEYKGFLTELIGGDVLTPNTDGVPGLAVVDVFGEYEMVFAAGHVLAGIHAAADQNAGEILAARLFGTIKEDRP